ncbi:MAG: hypothetical protein WKF46_10865 [Candidatus Limnocylindrales bacterium]
MSTAILIVAIVAGLACPLHMWWQQRRGRAAARCVPGAHKEGDIAALRARQQELERQIAATSEADREPSPVASR